MSSSEESIRGSLSLRGVPAQEEKLVGYGSGCLTATGRYLRREISLLPSICGVLGTCSPHCRGFKRISGHASVSPVVS